MSGLQKSHDPSRADYDWRMFAGFLRERLRADGRGYRKLATVIGVTTTDLSRAASGKELSVGKIIAICDWLNVAVRIFYLPPQKDGEISDCCTGSLMKQSSEAAE